MSKKPTLTIRYPEASEKALKLTEAMVKRSPGKRVVETESEDPIFPDGGDLFSSFIRCKTQTGVDLTLTLNPASMDFALETLIRPNLNTDERKQILGESEYEEQAELGLDNGAQAAQAPGQALDGSSSPDVPSAEREAATQSGEQEKQIEIGKLTDVDLRIILTELLDKYKNALVEDPERLIEDTIKEIDYEAGVIDLDETYQEHPGYCYGTYAAFGLILATIDRLPKDKKKLSAINYLKKLGGLVIEHITKSKDEPEVDFYHALVMGNRLLEEMPPSAGDPKKMWDDLTEDLYNEDRGLPLRKHNPTWEDLEKEAQTIGQKSEPAGESDQDSDIEPGLLNDIEDKKERGEDEQ